MITLPIKSNFKVKTKKLKNLPRYLNSKKYIIFSTHKEISVNNQTFSLFNYIKKNNYAETFDKANINCKVLLVGDFKDIIKPYRELQNRNKNVFILQYN